MLSRFAHAAPLSLCGAQRIHMLFNDHNALRKRRRRHNAQTAAEIAVDLPEDPWIAERPAPDHHHVAPGLVHHAHGVLHAFYVAVADDGHLYGFLHLTDNIPVRRRLIHLCARSAMHANGVHARIFAIFCDLHCVHAVFVPALTNFHRYGQVDRIFHGTDNVPTQRRLFHQGAAAVIARNFRHRATHIDINNIRPGRCGALCGRCKDERVVTEHLDGDGMFLFAKRDELLRFFIVILQRPRRDHFRHTVRCAERAAKLAKRPIGRARHRRQRRHTV